MALTEDEITAGATYTVSVSLASDRYFRQAVDLIKGIGRRNGSTAEYDKVTRTWTVTLSPTANRALADLREARSRYGAAVDKVRGIGAPAIYRTREGEISEAEARVLSGIDRTSAYQPPAELLSVAEALAARGLIEQNPVFPAVTQFTPAGWGAWQDVEGAMLDGEG